MRNINFVSRGTKDSSKLDCSNPLVYVSDSHISSMSYAGPASKIQESTTFDDNFKQILMKIKGQVSLGSTEGKLRNIHVYSSKAINLDGIERLCYLQQEGNQLLVSEYSGNRGAKYSALYKILLQELHKAGLVDDASGNFKINEEDIPGFVTILNSVIDRRASEEFELVAVDETDNIVIEKIRYYYFKAYWQVKENVNSNDTSTNGDKYLPPNNIDQVIKLLVEYSTHCNDKNELNELKEKLDRLNKLIITRIRNIEDFEALRSELQLKLIKGGM